jgi:hypothetical protein
MGLLEYGKLLNIIAVYSFRLVRESIEIGWADSIRGKNSYLNLRLDL